MTTLRELKSQILAEDSDLWINENDVARIKECLPADGSVSVDQVRVLAEMRAEASASCAAFDELFFPAFRQVLVADGRLSSSERVLLLRVLYGGGGIDDAERAFLRELRQELKEISPEFEALYRDALADD